MQKSCTYFMWFLNRLVRGLIRITFLFPLMAVTCLPGLIFDKVCRLNQKLDDWWWA